MFVLSLFNWIFIPAGFIDLPTQTAKDTINVSLLSYEGITHTMSNWDRIGTNRDAIWFLSLSESFEHIKYNLENSPISLLFIFAISSLNVYGVILAGWASNSKYAFLGALRSAAQMISYEVSLGLLIIPVVMWSGSLNLADIVKAQQNVWFIIPFFPVAILFYVSSLAETNRTPFDLPEAEAELVAGYNVEYSSITFAMFFLAEYSNMLVMSALTTCLFLGGWLVPFLGQSSTIIYALKITVIAFLFILVRAILPRYRYDQLLNIGWKLILPLSLSFLLPLIAYHMLILYEV
jgi:NADH-quinone oxidoreductase subunit H